MHPGRITTSFAIGSKRLYDFVDDNPLVELHTADHTKDMAVNSAIEVDLSGQVVADSFDFRLYSGIGGQMDFIRGAAPSHGGVPIIRSAIHHRRRHRQGAERAGREGPGRL